MPASFLIHAEIILQGDGGVGHVLGLDLHAFLGLDRLMQTIAPAASGHLAPGELVHDDDLAALHEIILVAMEESIGRATPVRDNPSDAPVRE